MLKVTVMHPEFLGEMARLHALERAREAAARHRHPLPRRPSWPVRLLARAGVRQRLGLALIGAGMRLVDPVAGQHARRRGAGESA